MTGQKKKTDSDELLTPDGRNGKDNLMDPKIPSIQPADLRTLIESRKESTKQLNTRLTLLQAIIEGADSGIFSFDTRCRYSSFNTKHARDMQEIYGSAITVGNELEEFVPIDKDVQKLLRLIRQALAGEQGVLYDYFGDHARSRRYFNLSCYPVRNASGSITGAAVIATDTTAWKKSERRLIEQEERFRHLVEDAPDFLYRMTLPGGKYEYVSPGSLAFTGYTPEEFSQKPGLLYDLVHSSGKDAFGRNLELLIKGMTPPPVEFPFIHRNGDLRWGFMRTILARDTAGHPLAVEGFITDITDWKKEQIGLEETKERYRMIFESADAGILLVDAETDIVSDANPRALEMIGAPREKVIGEVCNHIIYPSEDGVCPDTGTGTRTDSLEQCILTADGRKIPVLISTVPVTNSASHLLIVLFLDLSERKKAEETLRQGRARYQAFIENCSDGIFRYASGCQIPVTLPADEQADLLIRQGYLAECNHALARMYGYERAEELAGKKPGPVLDAEDPGTLEYLRQFIVDGYQGRDYETEKRDGSGNVRWFATAMTAIIEDGCLVNLWGVRRDATDRRNAEIALTENEERLRTLFQCMPAVAVQGFLPDYAVVSWNEASTSMFGHTAEEVMGKDIRDLLIPADTREEITDTCDRMALSGLPAPSTERYLLHKDGTRVPVLLSHAVVKIPGKSTILFCISVDLTERRKAETAVQDATKSLQSILDTAPFGTCVYELHDDGGLVFVSGNQTACRTLMTDCTSLVGLRIEEMLPALASTSIAEACRKAALTGEPYHCDAIDYETEGQRKSIEIHAVPLDKNRITVFFRDISDKRTADRELEQKVARIHAFLQNSPDIIQVLDQEKRLVYTSMAGYALQGFSEVSQDDSTIFDRVHPDDREHLAGYLEGISASTKPGIPVEYRMRDAGGDYRFVESVGVNLPGLPGGDGALITTRMIHERKRAEQMLSEREERFRSIFQHSNDAVYLFGITNSGMPGKIVDANDTAISQSGFAKDELLQKNLLELCSRDLTQSSRAIMMELLTRGVARFETQTVKSDGALLPVEISARLAKLKDKTYVVATSRDISQRKREERALRIANQKIQLMNVVAWHDIQNKVAGLLESVELAKDQGTAKSRKKFMDSEEEVLRIINRQLQYTREYQEMGLHSPRWVNLPQVLLLLVSSREIGLLKVRMDLHNLEIYCDPVIGKVFSHLIDNTRRHGEKATEIRFSCDETAEGLLLIYEDDGVGIPQERKKDLFIWGAGQATGFSLFFVHDILEISDMTIRETGEPGTGVRFEISVPKGLYRVGRKDS